MEPDPPNHLRLVPNTHRILASSVKFDIEPSLPVLLLAKVPASICRDQRPKLSATSNSPATMASKAISSPVPVTWYPTLAVVMVSLGLLFTASFFIYEATISRKNRSLAKEVITATFASFFLGFGSLFLLLASGVYV
ncbi:transmembrane protein 258 [Pyrus ussuriensis x Pyrus communis]|uniref:Dolichyl-diphosphooligosaccharide-protein glycosyltransferase subunit OST5 n=1 Tax=Pyrus ussuriensis x Pyrus communis TaxID=2448454 RepID=A0A5N5GX31_9ROSA|nr:transmembrane protein 258 [Pyrus ussuriensis x Pyrus communis]